MKAKLAIVVLGALALMANDASAKSRTANRPQARIQTQNPSSGGLYGSFSQGQQSYPNPDRELYVNRSCCSWSAHKARQKLVEDSGA
jgi:hypothetical protein